MKGQSEPTSGTDTTWRLNEEHLLREIAHYDQKAPEHTSTDKPMSRALATVYRYSAEEKREILAALRQGTPGIPSKFRY